MPISIRDAYGNALVRHGRNDERVVVLDADVSSSTKSCIFANEFPERFFNVGIAEANMVAMSAGLASVGMVPFANSFAVFISSIGLAAARAFGSYSKLPIRLVGAYGGLSDAFDGPSHHSLEDIAVMRALPNFEVYVPCDAAQVDWLIGHAIRSSSPMYIRLSRDSFPDIYSEGESFAPGKGRIVVDGEDLTVFACGLMVGHALKAAEQLRKSGISTRVVDMFSIKPIDRELILRCARETKAIVCAEEHNIHGGLGSAVAEVLAEMGCGVPLSYVGMKDCHGECGPYDALQKKYGLDPNAIVSSALSLLH